MLKALNSLMKKRTFQDTTPFSRELSQLEDSTHPPIEMAAIAYRPHTLANIELVPIVQSVLNKTLVQQAILPDALICSYVETTDLGKKKRHRINIMIKDWSEHLASHLPSMQSRILQEMHFLNPCIVSSYSVAWTFSPIICQIMGGPAKSARSVSHGHLPDLRT